MCSEFVVPQLREDFAQGTMRGVIAPLQQLSIPNVGPANEAMALRWTRLASSVASDFDFEKRLGRMLER